MSRADSPQDGIPSNPELAERMARVEENLDHVADTVDRIEDNVTDEQKQLAETVKTNRKRSAEMWTVYTLAKWGLPAGATIVGTIAAVGVL